MIISLLTTTILAIILLPILKGYKQVFRTDGPSTHFKKEGTPSMGGVIFIFGAVVSYIILLLINNQFNLQNLFILIPFLVYGLIGFLDDFLKHKKNHNEGLSPSKKALLQVFGAVLFFIIYLNLNLDTKIFNIDIKWIYGMFILIFFTACSNSANLTDGIDGLLTGVTIILLMFYYVITYNTYLNYFVLGLICALYIFLILNFNPAKIFMGDTGSLALGGVVGGLAILTKTELYLLILGIPYIIEALSVILQVLYYKKTKKRLFKMAPIHHHLEKIGFSEIKINAIFYILEIICVGISLFLYFYV